VKNSAGFVADILGFKGNVTETSYINYSGEIIHRVPINDNTNAYSIAVQVYKSKATQLTDGSLIGTVVDLINTTSGALKFTPINAGVKVVYESMRKIGFDLYKAVSNDGSQLAIVETQMSFIVANQCAADDSAAICRNKSKPNAVLFTFPFDFNLPIGPNNRVELQVQFGTRQSEIGKFSDGKFQRPFNWVNWLNQPEIAGKKLIPFLLDRDTTKSFVTALEKGKVEVQKYAESTADKNIAAGCIIIVNELAQYFSSPDVGALYWSLLENYLDKIDGIAGNNVCKTKYQEIYFTQYGLPSPGTSPMVAGVPNSAIDLAHTLQGVHFDLK
jgi:hypothetical protein